MDMYKTPYGTDVFVEISRDPKSDTATVFVITPMYITKRWEMPHQYKASQFTDSQIIADHDFVRVMDARYGKGLALCSTLVVLLTYNGKRNQP